MAVKDDALDELIVGLPNHAVQNEAAAAFLAMVEDERAAFDDAPEAERSSTLAMVRKALDNCRAKGDSVEKTLGSTCGALIRLGMSIDAGQRAG